MRAYGCVWVVGLPKEYSDMSMDIKIIGMTPSAPSSKLSLPDPKGPKPPQVSF